MNSAIGFFVTNQVSEDSWFPEIWRRESPFSLPPRVAVRRRLINEETRPRLTRFIRLSTTRHTRGLPRSLSHEPLSKIAFKVFRMPFVPRRKKDEKRH